MDGVARESAITHTHTDTETDTDTHTHTHTLHLVHASIRGLDCCCHVLAVVNMLR